MIIWINGLAGAGKSTTARALCARLEELQKQGKFEGKGVINIDGDEFRAVFDHTGYSKEARIKPIKNRISLTIALEKQGFCVINSAIALFNECYECNRKMCKDTNVKYIEIFLDCSFEVLEQRDKKGLYSRAKAGTQKDVVGIDIAYDKPMPNITLNGADNLENNIDKIIKYLASYK